MNIHPKLACGIYGLIYGIVGLFIEKGFHINLYSHVLFYIVGLILEAFVYKYFLDRYDGIE